MAKLNNKIENILAANKKLNIENQTYAIKRNALTQYLRTLTDVRNADKLASEFLSR